MHTQSPSGMFSNTELTRRLKKNEKLFLSQKLQTLPETKQSIEDLVASIELSAWEQSPAINHPDMPFYAFLALQETKLLLPQFATLMLYWSAAQLHAKENIQSILLLKDNELTEESTQHLFKDSSHLSLKPDELKNFVSEIKKLPVSEQRFFIVPFTDENEDILCGLKDTPFLEIFSEDFQYCYIFSLSMMQVLLNVRCKENAVVINPVLGASSLEDIRQNGLKSIRDLGLHFPHVKLPKKADTREASWYKFSVHDYYHAYIASHMPALHRQLMIKIHDNLSLFTKNNQVVTEDMINEFNPRIISIINGYLSENEQFRRTRQVALELEDMEHIYYRDVDMKLSIPNIFWISIAAKFAVNLVLNDKTHEELLLLILQTIKIENVPALVTEVNFNQLTHSLDIFLNSNQISYSERNVLTDIINELSRINGIWKKCLILEAVQQSPLFPWDESTPPLQKNESEQQWLERYIKPFFDFSNIYTVIEFSLQQKNTILMNICFRSLAENLNTVFDSPKFIRFQHAHPELMEPFMLELRKGDQFRDIFKEALIPPTNKAVIKFLLSNANINQLDAYGYTVLDYALESRNLILIEYLLLKKKANPNPQKGSKAMPALFSAAFHALYPAFELLTKCGFDKTIKYQGQTLEEYFYDLLSNPNTFAGCIQANPKPNTLFHEEYKLYVTAKKALLDAIKRGAIDPKKNITPPNTSFTEKTGRYMASILGIKEAIAWGCQRIDYSKEEKTELHANPLPTMKQNTTLFHKPKEQIHQELVKRLNPILLKNNIKNNFSVLINEYNYNKALRMASALKDTVGLIIVKILMEYKDNLNIDCNAPSLITKQTALHRAASHNLAIYNYLKENGGNIHKKDKKGLTPENIVNNEFKVDSASTLSIKK